MPVKSPIFANYNLMLPPIEQLPNDGHWQQLCKMLKAKVTLTTLVLSAWQMGLWSHRAIVEQQLTERAQALRRGPIALSAAPS